jgi:hypothetical protein
MFSRADNAAGQYPALGEPEPPAIPEGYIEISSAEQLASIGTNPEYPLDGNYFMTEDINLSDYEN